MDELVWHLPRLDPHMLCLARDALIACMERGGPDACQAEARAPARAHGLDEEEQEDLVARALVALFALNTAADDPRFVGCLTWGEDGHEYTSALLRACAATPLARDAWVSPFLDVDEVARLARAALETRTVH